jgi:sodium/proline symporter
VVGVTDDTFQLIALLGYFLLMLGIGAWGYRTATDDLDEYMLGGRRLGPAVSALSAGASDMSGWLLLGLPGAIYAAGLVEGWIAVGLTIGAWLNWKFVAPRLRAYTEVASNSITVPSFLANRLRDSSHLLRVASGVVILVFFTVYVSSGMVAGGLFFQSSFDSNYHTGVIVVGSVTVAYTLFGGFLAVCWTDFVQGLIMLLALVLVPTFALVAVGGPGEAADTIRSVGPDHLSMVSGASVLGVISAAAWGLGYFGQPHIIVRFMALRSAGEASRARRIGISWMLLALLGAVSTALVGLAYVTQNDLQLTDPETVFIELGQAVFHPLVAGVVLAAVLAAIMSTISSQLLVTSSALVEDIYQALLNTSASQRMLVLLGRLAVLGTALVAILLAWSQNNTVLGIVSYAWAGFGASFGPVVLLALWWRKLTAQGGLAGIVTGAVTVVVWGNVESLSSTMYEIVPGFVLSTLAAVVVSLATYRHDPEVEEEFERSAAMAR